MIRNKIYSSNDFMSLKKISRGYGSNPQWAINEWLKDPATLENIKLWENMHNLDFNNDKFVEICTCSLSHCCAPEINELIKNCKILSLFEARGNSVDIMVHRDLAIDFASWLSPAFKSYCAFRLLNSDTLDLCFRSEEDFIVSVSTVAKLVKQDSFNKFIIDNSDFKKNISCYNYYIRR